MTPTTATTQPLPKRQLNSTTISNNIDGARILPTGRILAKNVNLLLYVNNQNKRSSATACAKNVNLMQCSNNAIAEYTCRMRRGKGWLVQGTTNASLKNVVLMPTKKVGWHGYRTAQPPPPVVVVLWMMGSSCG